MKPHDLQPNAPRRGWLRMTPLLLFAALLSLSCAANPILLDSEPATGFALYRSGRLSPEELEALCREGVEEILVLDGTGGKRECRFREEHCPGLQVRYDRKQRAGTPLSAEFLEAFDRWIAEARAAGRKIAFRCRQGWHRTGRLAAYYQMKYQGLGPEEARAEMHRHGRFMWRHPGLDPQVEALYHHLQGVPCGTALRHCVRSGETDPRAWLEGDLPRFPSDACP